VTEYIKDKDGNQYLVSSSKEFSACSGCYYRSTMKCPRMARGSDILCHQIDTKSDACGKPYASIFVKADPLYIDMLKAAGEAVLLYEEVHYGWTYRGRDR
jgi:hypothetical protein